MKILNILNEAKFAKPILAYHATTLDNLRSIIKQGLIPNFKSDGYGSGEESPFGVPLTALSGNYLTYDSEDSRFIAGNLEGNPVILICKVQQKQLEWDEDRLSAGLFDEKSLRDKLSQARKDNASKEELYTIASEHTRNVISKLPKNLISNTKAPQLIQSYFQKLTQIFLQDFDTDSDDIEQFKVLQNSLTKRLRLLLKKRLGSVTTFKIDAPIKFTGPNKIVGIYSLLYRIGWGDIGGFQGEEYHLYKTPMELLTAINKHDTM